MDVCWMDKKKCLQVPKRAARPPHLGGLRMITQMATTAICKAMADMTISGEVPLSPSIFRDHAMESKLKGAPIDWVAMEGVPTNAGGTAILYRAPHPHAAVLMADYILGPEGQKILEDLQFGSPSKDFGFQRWYPEAGMNTEQYDQAAGRWQKALREVGRKG